MNTIITKITKEDALALDKSIIDLEASLEFYTEAQKNMTITPQALKLVSEYYMETLRTHKLLWNQILIKYVGEEDASLFNRIYRYDMYKQVIFKMELDGCQLCQKK